MTETLCGNHRFTTAGTAVADEVDPVLDIFTELDKVLFPGLVQQFLAFAAVDPPDILIADQ